MKKIHNKEEMQKALEQDGIQVFLISTAWCPDCVYIKPFMPALEAKYQDRINFYEMDRDECLDLAIELGVMGIPSFLAFKDGKQIHSFVSSLRKTEQEIDSFLAETVDRGEE